ncbi:lactoylglutathione lyase [Leuconostocaceae bacterium ESL0958]|nr:lactoylglutathione lyase [Leuconostocaceae bacterium ESL0958]
MKVRKLDHKTIPCQDPNRAFRFWRDCFDLPQAGPASQRQLLVDGQPLTFVAGQPGQAFELLVRDHEQALQAHLANCFIPVLTREERPQHKLALTVHDSEGNVVVIEGNQD